MIDELLQGTKASPVVVGRLVLNDDERVAAWVAERVPVLMGRNPNNLFRAIGVVDVNLKLIAAVVYHNYIPGVDVECTMAADTPKWATPGTLAALFDFAFGQLGVKRMTCMVDAPNKRCRRFLEGVGFHIEGVHDLAFDGVIDMVSYGITAPELIYKPRARNGQEVQSGGAARS